MSEMENGEGSDFDMSDADGGSDTRPPETPTIAPASMLSTPTAPGGEPRYSVLRDQIGETREIVGDVRCAVERLHKEVLARSEAGEVAVRALIADSKRLRAEVRIALALKAKKGRPEGSKTRKRAAPERVKPLRPIRRKKGARR